MARLATVAIAVAVLAMAAGAASQSPAPAPAPVLPADCSAAVTGLIGCVAYVRQGSEQSRPAQGCCDGVKGALRSPAAVACLCMAFGQDYGVPINLTRAAGLPTACGGDPAAFSQCNIKVPGVPTEAPAPSSGSAPAPGSPRPANSAAARSPISAMAVLVAMAASLLSYYYL